MEIKHKKTEYLNAKHFIEEEINNVTCCTHFVLEPANPILENILLIFAKYRPEVNKQMTESKNKKSPEDPVVVHLHSTFGYVSPFDTMYFVIPGITSWYILHPCHQTF